MARGGGEEEEMMAAWLWKPVWTVAYSVTCPMRSVLLEERRS